MKEHVNKMTRAIRILMGVIENEEGFTSLHKAIITEGITAGDDALKAYRSQERDLEVMKKLREVDKRDVRILESKVEGLEAELSRRSAPTQSKSDDWKIMWMILVSISFFTGGFLAACILLNAL